MPLAFRNLTITPDDPVSEWGLEGIQTALERGDISHWRRIAAEVRRDPWGKVTSDLVAVLSYCHPYGVGDLMADVVASARADAEQSERASVAAEVREIVEASGVTAAEFAARIGTSPSRLSTYMTGKVIPSAALMVRMRRLSSARSSHIAPYVENHVGQPCPHCQTTSQRWRPTRQPFDPAATAVRQVLSPRWPNRGGVGR